MPVMDGLSTIRELRSMEKTGTLTGHLPVLAVTANARQEQIENVSSGGRCPSEHGYELHVSANADPLLVSSHTDDTEWF